MEEKLTKELADNLIKIKGETRGVVLRTDAEFVLAEKGKEGLKKVEQELKRLGYPVNYDKIEKMAFYPLGLRMLSLLVIQKVFNFSKEDIKRMGAQAPKKSLIIKLFLKYFVSLNRTGKQGPKMWKKHYTLGQLSVDPHEKEKWAIVRLKGFSPHPIMCSYLEGYLTTVGRMIVATQGNTKETKCTFRGDKYHEYFFTW